MRQKRGERKSGVVEKLGEVVEYLRKNRFAPKMRRQYQKKGVPLQSKKKGIDYVVEDF